MSVEQAIATAVIGTGLGVVGKVFYDVLRFGRNGNKKAPQSGNGSGFMTYKATQKFFKEEKTECMVGLQKDFKILKGEMSSQFNEIAGKVISRLDRGDDLFDRIEDTLKDHQERFKDLEETINNKFP